MKTGKLLLLLTVLFQMMHLDASAQARKIKQRESFGTNNEMVLNARQAINISFAQNQLLITHLQEAGYDKIIVFNMQGEVSLQQSVRSSAMVLDLAGLTEGVYLLVLRSSATLKEKTIKFVVKK